MTVSAWRPKRARLREMIAFGAERLTELEVAALTGARHGEKTPYRLMQRNGYPSRGGWLINPAQPGDRLLGRRLAPPRLGRRSSSDARARRSAMALRCGRPYRRRSDRLGPGTASGGRDRGGISDDGLATAMDEHGVAVAEEAVAAQLLSDLADR